MKKFFTLCAVLPFLISAAPADAATGRVMLASDYYVVVQLDPSYLDRYTGARMYSFLPGGVRAGDRVSGIENTWGRQTWTVDGHELSVGVDKWDVPAEEAMAYFSENTR